MSEMFGQSDRALSRAAGFVDEARGDVAGKCEVLSARVAEMLGGWGGQGAKAFDGLMGTWQDRRRQILAALEQLSASLVETERDNTATDEAIAVAQGRVADRLG